MASINNNKKVHRVVPMSHMLKNRGDSASSLNKKLNQELIYSYNLIKLSEQEIATRTKIFKIFKNAIESELDCSVESYGSFRTNLMVYDSDLDITILTKGLDYKRDTEDSLSSKPSVNKLLAKVIEILNSRKIATGPIVHIKNARCPIIKCKDSLFQYKIDISVDKYDAIDSAKYVISRLEEKPYLKSFLILIKYFLKRRQLSETIRGGLCSYAQFLLVLNFIQLHPLVQSNRISVEENLGVLLMDFFQLYGSEFPFDKSIISVENVRYKPNREDLINIEDPVSPGHNVALGCTSLHMVKEIFNYSYKIMSAAFRNKVATDKAIGELWLRINDKEIRIRKKIKNV